MRYFRRSTLLVGMLAGLILAGCGKKPDPGVLLNKEGLNRFNEATRSAESGNLDEAKKLLSEAEARFRKAVSVSRSVYHRNRARTYLQDVRELRSEIARVEERLRAEEQKKKAEEEARKAEWLATGRDEAPSEAAAGDSGVGSSLTSATDEENAARRSQLGSRAQSVAIEDALTNFEPDPLDGSTKESVTVVKEAAASADPLVVEKIERKGDAIVVYGTFNNKGNPAAIVQVTADLQDDTGHTYTTAFQSYLRTGFAPNWDDIFESKGQPITADEIVVPANSSMGFVLVNTSDSANRITKARVEVRLRDNRVFKETGPR